MSQFWGYGDYIQLQSADNLITHKTCDGHVVVIEYELHVIVFVTGFKYDNRFCSVIKIKNRKSAHWRDYMHSLAAWKASTAPTSVRERSYEVIRRTVGNKNSITT